MSFKKTSRERGILLKIAKNQRRRKAFFFHHRCCGPKLYEIILLTKIILVTKIYAVISKRKSSSFQKDSGKA